MAVGYRAVPVPSLNFVPMGRNLQAFRIRPQDALGVASASKRPKRR